MWPVTVKVVHSGAEQDAGGQLKNKCLQEVTGLVFYLDSSDVIIIRCVYMKAAGLSVTK